MLIDPKTRSGEAVVLLSATAIGAILVAVHLRLSNWEHANGLRAWREQADAWVKPWVCERCEIALDPSSGTHIPASRLPEVFAKMREVSR